MDRLFHWIDLLNGELGQKNPALALIVGFVVSWALTQALKQWGPLFKQTSDPAYRTVVRLTAFVLGAFPTWALWPHRGALALWMALMVGILSPVAYTAFVRLIRHFWPWLADAASGRPES